ncbi:MAG: MlaE family lipid ABC transporter permease subunit [Alphaproteobacteria bacterium]|nr:MlaE family lipid ABC transporter permease subunit [Alphaproteobacteria bacterium]MBO6627455.1 MlaE family lipid ABC transporter permease subunit [Alphaproteobacteria bacterium]MDF1627094.1 MlaE family lipid ABC transporter permease subunit [Parvibaculaceae bacterium]
MNGQTAGLETKETEAGFLVRATGEWTIRHVGDLDEPLRALTPQRSRGRSAVIDLGRVSRLDTAGAWLLHRTHEQLRLLGLQVSYHGETPEIRTLLGVAEAYQFGFDLRLPRQSFFEEQAERVGGYVVAGLEEVRGLVGFFGILLQVLWRTVKSPRRLRLVPLVHHMERAGFDALPIVCLITFLIGAVLAQQGAVQLQRFGAEIFTVNLVAITFLREVGILLTAIIVAGRSGSAFTAEIGSMKMREEVDAMRTLGLDPMDMLVVPRVLALVVMLPLLTFVADMMGLIGGALVVWETQNTSPGVFIVRLSEAANFWTFGVGLLKAPFMALMIGMIGCYSGLKVTGSAESVGQQTTQSVVKSIFMVIILDALFAVFFTAMGI